MTKKDYELFASEIYKRDLTDVERATLYLVCVSVFSSDNPTFKADKFLEACTEGKHIRKSIKGGI